MCLRKATRSSQRISRSATDCDRIQRPKRPMRLSKRLWQSTIKNTMAWPTAMQKQSLSKACSQKQSKSAPGQKTSTRVALPHRPIGPQKCLQTEASHCALSASPRNPPGFHRCRHRPNRPFYPASHLYPDLVCPLYPSDLRLQEQASILCCRN